MSDFIKIRLNDIIKTISQIENYLQKRKLHECHDVEVYGIIHCLQIIGEACRAIPEDFRNKYSYVNWSNIIGMRHLIVHEYSKIDYEIIEDVINNHLHVLKEQVEKILKELN